MSTSPRGDLYRVVLNSAGKKQTTFGAPLANVDLDLALSVRVLNALQVRRTFDEIRDCQGYKTSSRLLTRIGHFNLDIEFNADILAIVTAYTLGVAASPSGGGPFTHAISMLTGNDFVPPFTTFWMGLDDGDDDGIIFYDATFNNFELSAVAGERVKLTAEVFGRGDMLAASGFTPPACEAVVPLRMEDGALDVKGENVMDNSDANHTTTEFTLRYDNALLVNKDPFVLGTVDIGRPIERGGNEQRNYSATWKVGGRPNDPVATDAQARDDTYSFAFRVGSTTEGVTYTAALAEIQAEEQMQTFEDEGKRSTLNLKLEPLRDPGDATTPLVVSAVTDQATAYLGT